MITLIALMALFLNQSSVIFGINFSFSDILALLVIAIIIIKFCFVVPLVPVLFFLFLTSTVLVTANFYIPLVFSYNTEIRLVLRDTIKLVASFMYLLIGYNITKLKLAQHMVKWFTLGALLISIISAFYLLTDIKVFSDLFFYGGIRFKGLMSDPNYFAILQISGIVYFIRNTSINIRFRVVLIIFLILSVITSNSKTGIITLLLYLVFMFFTSFFNFNIKDKKIVIRRFITLLLIICLIILLISYLNLILNIIMEYIPAFKRVTMLFYNFGDAISESGSGRSNAWNIAYKTIKVSPILGVGTGTFLELSRKIWDYSVEAHNTYLQMTVEWGIILAIIFFIYVIFNVIKISFIRKEVTNDVLVLRDIIIVFLIGSMAISLNNARIFWVILGSLIYSIYEISAKEKETQLRKSS